MARQALGTRQPCSIFRELLSVFCVLIRCDFYIHYQTLFQGGDFSLNLLNL